MNYSIPHQNGTTPVVRCAGTLSVEMPSDWSFRESYTLLAPDGQANLITSTEPVDADLTAADYATAQGDLLTTQFPGFTQIDFYEIGIAGLPEPAFYREFSWTPEGSAAITQMQIYAVAAGGGRGITATGTATSEQFGRYRDALYRQLTSLVHASADVPLSLPRATARP